MSVLVVRVSILQGFSSFLISSEELGGLDSIVSIYVIAVAEESKMK